MDDEELTSVEFLNATMMTAMFWLYGRLVKLEEENKKLRFNQEKIIEQMKKQRIVPINLKELADRLFPNGNSPNKILEKEAEAKLGMDFGVFSPDAAKMVRDHRKLVRHGKANELRQEKVFEIVWNTFQTLRKFLKTQNIPLVHFEDPKSLPK